MGARPGLPAPREWHDQGFTGLRMAVNLSTPTPNCREWSITTFMQIYRLPPRSLELEVTETGLMEDISTAAQHLLSLRRSGALIAIDDFVTGYSSLSYLKSLPLDKIKIDKSFVQDCWTTMTITIVRAIIQLGKSSGDAGDRRGRENRDTRGLYHLRRLPRVRLSLIRATAIASAGNWQLV